MNRFRFLLIVLVIISLGGAIIFLLSGEKTVTLDSSAWTDSEASLEDPVSRSESFPPAAETEAEGVFLEILPVDCENECALFLSEKDKERYCRNVCGLTAENNDTASAAPYQESVERKNAAIKNKDLGACSDITDANLRKSCEVRVTEDLLE